MLRGKYKRTEKNKYWLGKTGNEHPMHGRCRTLETKRKISEAKKGKVLSEETKRKMSRNNARYWLGKTRDVETKKKISRSQLGKRTGEKHPMYGKHHTEESKKKMSEKNKGLIPWNKGKSNIYSTLTLFLMSKAKIGNKSPAWKGGISFEPYSSRFNKQLKELIRNRDNYKCQKCGCPEVENIEKLSVHHIDYNKKNSLPSNLISLCRRCNSIVNFNRIYWLMYFTKKVMSWT